MKSSPPAIQIEQAGFSYMKSRRIFQEINFSLSYGDVLTILGPNGAGKSTLLNCIAGYLPLSYGNILINGKRISRYSLEELAQEIAYVPQIQTATLQWNVRDYVLMGRAPHIGIMSKPSHMDYHKAEEAIDMMGISHLSGQSFGSLSGGERQQVQIARALAQESKIIMMDEPTNHLDYGNQLRILKIVASLSEKGYSIILTTHMPDHAILLDGQTGILQPNGKMIVGPAKEVISQQSLESLYHTDLHVVYIPEVGRTCCIAGSLSNKKQRKIENCQIKNGFLL